MRPHSILVHGDTPGAVALARAIRQEIHAAGGQVVSVSRLDLAVPSLKREGRPFNGRAGRADGAAPAMAASTAKYKTLLSLQSQSLLALRGLRR